MRVDPKADRARWIGEKFSELRAHRRASYDTLKAWLYARGMGTQNGVIIRRKPADERKIDLDALRVNRDPCFWCGTRADLSSPSCRKTAHPTPGASPLAGPATSRGGGHAFPAALGVGA